MPTVRTGINISCSLDMVIERDLVRIPSEMFSLFDDMNLVLSGCCIPLIPKKGMIKERNLKDKERKLW
jgi:hypothetical protein